MTGNAKSTLGSAVEFHDIHFLVYHNRDVGSLTEHKVGKGLSTLLHVRYAHGELRLILIDSDSLLAAGRISTGTTVELILGRGFADLRKNHADRLFIRDILLDGAIHKGHAHGDRSIHCRIALFFIGILFYPQLHGKTGGLVLYRDWTIDAGVLTHIHFDKAVIQLATL